MIDLSGIKTGSFDWVEAINIFHWLPVNKREKFVHEMIRISRYGVFFNQVITNNLGTFAADVLFSTLFTDWTGFFSEIEADELLKSMNIKHYTFFPMIQGESRLGVMYTSKNDVPISRIPELSASQRDVLTKNNVHTAKDFLTAGTTVYADLGADADKLRASAVKLLFP